MSLEKNLNFIQKLFKKFLYKFLKIFRLLTFHRLHTDFFFLLESFAFSGSFTGISAEIILKFLRFKIFHKFLKKSNRDYFRILSRNYLKNSLRTTLWDFLQQIIHSVLQKLYQTTYTMINSSHIL